LVLSFKFSILQTTILYAFCKTEYIQ
jgi:hypothetical protein